MEWRHAPFFVNRFLCFNERQCLLNLHKLNLINARKFCKAFIFIDVQDILNCGSKFEQYISQ